ncbi:trypsin-like serine peptidase [Protaetiibacter larvae]|uniref:Trypsin-like peptidase domain-containing protein n=1 Tax=Protaetiibacter larvae TaxID=2592654 RepID=A0A5C1Y930_9MICO|nr:trypsin-like peptidase domain-containing protein [Protaetiibacter larvae]QEO10160.1 trypsin-like peptidase domain-containing protein [Protaetiibacter larvae]
MSEGPSTIPAGRYPDAENPGGQRWWSVVAAAAVLLLAGCTTPPAPDPTPEPGPPPDSGIPAPAPPLGLDELTAFSGVVKLTAGANCSGTLVDTGVPDGPAWVLTNGHCTGDLSRFGQQTTVGMAWAGEAEFLRADGNLDGTLTRDVAELAYSTMRFTDTAIVRLDGTLGELEDLGIRPVPIADAEPAAGERVVNVGVPVQNLMDDEWVLRRGECTLDGQRTLIELSWIWFDVWANDCPGIIQGSSGSPLLRADADGAPEAIVAVINTTTTGDRFSPGGDCFINRPCEVHDGVAGLVADTSYAQSVAGLGDCFDPDSGEFALGGNCPLPAGDVWVESGGGPFRGGTLPDGFGRPPQLALVGAEAGTVRTAVVPFGDGRACLDAASYDGAASVSLPQAGERWETLGVHIPVTLPENEGHYLACAVRDDGYDRAAAVLFEVDRTPPVLPADAEVTRAEDGSVLIRPHFSPPEIAAVRYGWGPLGELDCDDPSGFREFLIVPLRLERHELPASYCLYGMDLAGNPTPVTRIDVPRE